jgi:hypothetical protein
MWCLWFLIVSPAAFAMATAFCSAFGIGLPAAFTRGRVWLEALPGYAPDLNPCDEGGWNHLKNLEMGNLVCRDLDELHQGFHLAIGRLRPKPHRVQSFFAQAGLAIKKT